MNKPTWENAPAWANWLAMDRDGYWFWYENEPYPKGGSFRSHGRISMAQTNERASWASTKEGRP